MRVNPHHVDDGAAERKKASRRAARAGRRCAHDGCGVFLSIYNDDDVCWQHQPHVMLLRGRR